MQYLDDVVFREMLKICCYSTDTSVLIQERIGANQMINIENSIAFRMTITKRRLCVMKHGETATKDRIFQDGKVRKCRWW